MRDTPDPDVLDPTVAWLDSPIALTVVEYPSGAVHIDAADHALVTTGGLLLRRTDDLRMLHRELTRIIEHRERGL